MFHPPLDTQWKLLSRYGIRPGRVSRTPTYHAGLDLGGSGVTGTAVYAVAPGVVERVVPNTAGRGPFAGYGNAVVIRHDGLSWDGHSPIWSFYAHMQQAVVQVDQRVDGGAIVGNVGNTTNGKFAGMGAHLHMEIRKARRDGQSPYPGQYRVYNLDPEPWLESLGIRFGSHGEILFESRSTPSAPAAIGVSVGRAIGIAVLDPLRAIRGDR